MKDNLDQIIVALCSLAAAIILFVWPDKTQLAGLITSTVGPTLSIVVGIIYTWIAGSQKIEVAKQRTAELQYKLAMLSPKGTGAKPSASTIPTYTYTSKDVEIVESEAKADIQGNSLTVDKLNFAEYNYTHMSNYDLRPVARELRVDLAKEFLDNEVSLLNDAWVFATNIQTPPTPEQAASKSTSMYYFKKEWEKANGLKCGDNVYTTMSTLLGYYNGTYSALSGVESLIGKTVDYSVFGGGMFSPTSLGWEAANLVV
jgi:hypothetical protein